MFCTKCGNQMDDNSRFCTKCGTPVANKPTASQAKEISKTQEMQVVDEPIQEQSSQPKKKSAGRVILVIALILVFLALCAVGGFFGYRAWQAKTNETAIKELTEKAQECVEEGDLEGAISYYLDILEIDASDPVVFVNLAEVYKESSQIEKAIKILEKGYEITESRKLKKLIETYEELKDTQNSADVSSLSEDSLPVPDQKVTANPESEETITPIAGAFSSIYAEQDYMIEDSGSRSLTNSDLSGLSLAQLRIARNEIFARHGRQFRDALLNQWFYSKTWYLNLADKYAPDDFDAIRPSPLSKTELENIEYIKAYEDDMVRNQDIYPEAASIRLTDYDLALSKEVLKTALSQMQKYTSTDILNENISLVQEAIDKEEVQY